mmetsp:Transcript_8262/g.10746  ORF Transcript_8262/g.10746 Transcript_8262/m.10746 type:complete len:446 (-) Transcript_8262:1116-2453(-)|eukprot:CAMPEP_0184024550 /NCGR_PEP_ID=MMETSP0954-20121128/12163_1 /TAXON_ID=627963 /ORGANISM="Aplanochytrium sp, Strain PBS07" /LENGTH=445 /DNA_ID=CAMNT_0026307927 /DNA_START=175 /DNA_END=1515 /DNA_ORIENTATION=+
MLLKLLFPRPKFAADWKGTYEEKAAEWSELFLDLVMVSGCANVSEILKEDLTWNGLMKFLAIFSLLLSGWQLYLFYTCRYSDNSFVGDFVTFAYFYGMSFMVMNAEPGVKFTTGAIMQRIAMILFYMIVFRTLVAARTQLIYEFCILFTGLLILGTSLAFGEDRAIYFYALTILVEVPINYELMARVWNYLKSRDICVSPANIDHYTERQGCLLMVVLGESVVSAVINTNDVMERSKTKLFMVVGISLLITYSIALFYFSIIPPRELNAQRRSVRHGLSYTLANQILFVCLLAMGVGIKFITSAILDDKHLNTIQLNVLFIPTAISMFCMLIIRLLHFWGREPRENDPEIVKQIKYFWWGSIMVSPVLPILGNLLLRYVYNKSIPPEAAVTTLFLTVFVYIILEQLIAHYLRALGYGYLSDSTEETTSLLRNEGYGSVETSMSAS